MLKHLTLLAPTIVSLFWMLFFFLHRKEGSRTHNVWMAAMVVIAVSMTASGAYWYIGDDYNHYWKLDILETFSTLSFIPAIYFYFKTLTGDQGKHSVLKACLLLFPPVFIGGVTAFGYLYLGEDQAAAFARNLVEGTGDERFFPDNAFFRAAHLLVNEYTYSAAFLLQAVFVVIYAARRLFRYRKRLEDFFSNVDGKDMRHNWAVLWGILVLMLLSAIIASSGYLLYIEYDIWSSIIPVLFAAVLYFICYHVYRSGYNAESFERELAVSDLQATGHGYGSMNDTDTDIPDPLFARILPELTRVMSEDKMFLKSDLRLDEVAQKIQTNRTYISRVIREQYGCNFSDYVNGMRVGYAKELAIQNPNYTQECIAGESGFTNSSTFSRTFKKLEDMTFRQWQSEL